MDPGPLKIFALQRQGYTGFQLMRISLTYLAQPGQKLASLYNRQDYPCSPILYTLLQYHTFHFMAFHLILHQPYGMPGLVPIYLLCTSQLCPSFMFLQCGSLRNDPALQNEVEAMRILVLKKCVPTRHPECPCPKSVNSPWNCFP